MTALFELILALVVPSTVSVTRESRRGKKSCRSVRSHTNLSEEVVRNMEEVCVFVCGMQGKCGGQLKTGTQRISFFSFEVSSNALQRLSARMTVQEGWRVGGSVTMHSKLRLFSVSNNEFQSHVSCGWGSHHRFPKTPLILFYKIPIII